MMQVSLHKTDAVASGDQLGPCYLKIEDSESSRCILEAFFPIVALAERLLSSTELSLLIEAISNYESHNPEKPNDALSLLADYMEEQGCGIGAVLARNNMPLGLLLTAVFQWGK